MAERLYLGIEIGGTKLQVGAGPADGTLAGWIRRRVDPARGAAGIRDQITEAVTTLRDALDRPRFEAVGIGFGGPLDADRGIITESHQIAGWTGYPLADWARQTLGIRAVVLQNDADTAALGEARAGAGRGCSPLLYVTIGSGIGGGLILDDRIYRGAGQGAVEIGHLWIHPEPGPEGPVPGETVRGPQRLEELASGWGMGQAARREARRRIAGADPAIAPLARRAGFDPEAITAALVAEVAATGDPLCQAWLAHAAAAFGQGLTHAVTLLGPRRVVLGGGVSLMPEPLWLEPVRAEVDRRVFAPFRGQFDIVTAQLGEAVVLHGALALAADAVATRSGGGSRPPGPRARRALRSAT